MSCFCAPFVFLLCDFLVNCFLWSSVFLLYIYSWFSPVLCCHLSSFPWFISALAFLKFMFLSLCLLSYFIYWVLFGPLRSCLHSLHSLSLPSRLCDYLFVLRLLHHLSWVHLSLLPLVHKFHFLVSLVRLSYCSVCSSPFTLSKFLWDKIPPSPVGLLMTRLCLLWICLPVLLVLPGVIKLDCSQLPLSQPVPRGNIRWSELNSSETLTPDHENCPLFLCLCLVKYIKTLSKQVMIWSPLSELISMAAQTQQNHHSTSSMKNCSVSEEPICPQRTVLSMKNPSVHQELFCLWRTILTMKNPSVHEELFCLRRNLLSMKNCSVHEELYWLWRTLLPMKNCSVHEEPFCPWRTLLPMKNPLSQHNG